MVKEIKKHLKERYLDIKKYHCYVSEENCCVTFLLFNLSGQIVGYNCYRPNGIKKKTKGLKEEFLKYKSFIENENHKGAVFGLETLNPKKKIIFLTEGVFDACRVHNKGLNCLALLGATSSSNNSLINFLYLMSKNYEIIPICEGDKAGKKLKKYSTKGRYIDIVEGKDMGDLSEEEVDELLKDFI